VLVLQSRYDFIGVGAAVNGFSLGVMVVSFFRAILEDVTRWIDKV